MEGFLEKKQWSLKAGFLDDMYFYCQQQLVKTTTPEKL